MNRRMDGWMDRQTDGRTPCLQPEIMLYRNLTFSPKFRCLIRRTSSRATFLQNILKHKKVIWLTLHLCVSSFYLSICLSVYLSVCLSVCSTELLLAGLCLAVFLPVFLPLAVSHGLPCLPIFFLIPISPSLQEATLYEGLSFVPWVCLLDWRFPKAVNSRKF